MKTTKIILLLSIIAICTSLFAQNLDSLLNVADEIYDAKQYEEEFKILKKAETIAPNDFEIIWRLARVHFNLSDNTTDENVKSDNIYAGFDYAEMALEMDSYRAESHKWFGILIGRKGEIEGTKQKIINSYQVREHTLKAIEIDPGDDGNYHVMGQWHFKLADLSWFERTIAGIIYETPPKASFEDARDYFQKAIELDPDDIRNYVWLGKTFEKLDDKQSAENVFHQAIAKPTKSDSDIILQDEARELLKNK